MLNSEAELCLRRDGNIFEVSAQLTYETHMRTRDIICKKPMKTYKIQCSLIQANKRSKMHLYTVCLFCKGFHVEIKKASSPSEVHEQLANKSICSQNHWGWRRPLGSLSPTVNPALPSSPLNRVLGAVSATSPGMLTQPLPSAACPNAW